MGQIKDSQIDKYTASTGKTEAVESLTNKQTGEKAEYTSGTLPQRERTINLLCISKNSRKY